MADLRSSILPALQKFRNLSVELGFRLYSVWLRKITWSGGRVGLGTSTTVDTYLGKPKVRQVSSSDVIVGSEMSEDMFEIGPFTPAHTGVSLTPDTLAVTPADLAPAPTGTPTEVYFVIKGPGLPEDGALFARVSDNSVKPLRYTIKVKAIGRKA